MKVLVLNCGSSSIKYQLIGMPGSEMLAKGVVERIGESEGILKHNGPKGRQVLNRRFADHAEGLQKVLELLTAGDPLHDISEIDACGHRVVHGGEKLTHTVRVSEEVIKCIEEIDPLDPLHCGAHVLGIRVVKRLLPNLEQVCVFDTAFHQTMPKHAYLYALPYHLYEQDHIRRYGFHGTSHEYVAKRVAALMGKKIEDLRIVTCHLGNGSSVSAVQYGKCVDTSMGLTPLEGLVMGTRCGDIDPAILTYLGRTKGWSAEKLDHMINKESGLLGISQISNDCRVLEDLAKEGNERAVLALDIFCYRIKKYIGAYVAAMGGLDAVVFTAGIGENSPYVRERVCKDMAYFGISVDLEQNDVYSKERKISGSGSKTEVWVVPTNEEAAIAEQTYELLTHG